MLPLELWQEVFEIIVFENATTSLEPGVLKSSPLPLCHVCRAWRAAALGCCRLWVYLKLPTSTIERAKTLEQLRNALASLEAQALFWIGNAGEKGLRLCLEVAEPADMPPEELLDDSDRVSDEGDGEGEMPVIALPSYLTKPRRFLILQAWTAFLDRVFLQGGRGIRGFEVYPTARRKWHNALSTDVTNYMFSTISRMESARLQDLVLVGESLQLNNTGVGAPGAGHFSHCPRLKRVALVFSTFRSEMIPTGNVVDEVFPIQVVRRKPTENFLPWRQITHLEITMECPGPWWKFVLRECSAQLEACSMHLEALPDLADEASNPQSLPPHPPSDGTVMSSLKHLVFTPEENYTASWFDDFQFPVLEKLRLACEMDNGFPTFMWSSGQAAAPRLPTQLKALKSLTLSFQNISTEELISILRETDVLEELAVDSYLRKHKLFLEQLTLGTQPHRRRLLPNLKKLALYLEYGGEERTEDFHEDDLLRFMVSRSLRAAVVAEHTCIMNSFEVEGVYTTSITSTSNPPAGVSNESTTSRPSQLQALAQSASLRSVELWYDHSEQAEKFLKLDKFQQNLAKEAEHNMEVGGSVPAELLLTAPFQFLMECSSPSDWLQKSYEPLWYDSS